MTEIATPHFATLPEAEEAPTWKSFCRIDNEPVGEIESGKVSYDEDGSSGLEFKIFDNGYFETRAKFRRADVWVQRGLSERLYYVFTGEVQHARTSDTGLTKIEAFGPRNLLARRFFEEKVTFVNTQLQNFVAVIRDRFNERGSVFDFAVGADFLVENEPFSGQTALLEGLDKVLGAAYFVAADRPDYRLLIGPKPRPGLRRMTFGDPIEVTYLDYEPGALEVPEDPDGPYAQVIAYKNNDESEEIWRESADVANRAGQKVNNSQIYWLDDYPGSQTQAAQQVALIAGGLENSAVLPTIKGLPFRVPFFTYDPVDLVERREYTGNLEGRIGAFIRYATTVRSSNLDLVTGKYDLDLSGVEINRRWERSPEVSGLAGPYVLKTTQADL